MRKHVVIALVCLQLPFAAQAAATLDCPVVAGGGSQTAVGHVFVLGQPLAGFSSGSQPLDIGAVPCWFGGSSGACPEDINGNGTVDLSDLAEVLSEFGEIGAGFASDVDGDGDVDLSDLAAVLANFGEVCP